MNAVITGASRGIGKAIAERFLKEGFNIAFCSRKEVDLQTVSKEWQSQYPQSTTYYQAVDLADKKAVKSFAKFIIEKMGTIDVLVNNAGVFIPGSIQEEPEDALEQLIAANVYSAYHLTRALLPVMIPQQKGHIFNVCSVASLLPYTASGAYTISKHALYGFSRSLREELKEQRIKVTGLFPGAVYTKSWEGAGFPPERMMSVEDVAETVYACYQLSERTVIEDVIMRPMLGDL